MKNILILTGIVAVSVLYAGEQALADSTGTVPNARQQTTNCMAEQTAKNDRASKEQMEKTCRELLKEHKSASPSSNGMNGTSKEAPSSSIAPKRYRRDADAARRRADSAAWKPSASLTPRHQPNSPRHRKVLRCRELQRSRGSTICP